MLDLRLKGEVGGGLEGLDFAVTRNDKRERGRLDSAHGENRLLRPAPLGAQGIGPAEVHADKPVGALPGKRRVLEALIVLVVLQCGKAALNGNRILRGYPKPLHVAPVLEVVEHLVHLELTFTVGVASIDNLGRILEQAANHRELRLRVVLGQQGPGLRDDGQVFGPPLGVLLTVVLGLCHFKDVPEAPGHAVGATLKVAFSAGDIAQLGGDGLRHRWFFSDKQAHSLLSG